MRAPIFRALGRGDRGRDVHRYAEGGHLGSPVLYSAAEQRFDRVRREW
jgi:hypothetical protein